MAAHGRPREARGAVRRQLPADRLRAVQPGQRRDAPHLRAHPVQVALPRPAHLHHVAAVQRARAVHHHGAGAAAARPPLVHRQRRRDLPEPQPRLRRAARLHRGVRRRPRLPDGPGPDDRRAHRERRGRHRRRASGCRAPRRRRSAASAPTRPARITEFLEKPSRPAVGARRPRGHVRLDGQLRLHHRGAAGGAARPTPRTATPTTTWAATSSRAWSAQGDARVYDFAENDRARRHRPRRGLLARRRHDRRLLRGAHRSRLGAPDLQPVQPALADPHGDRRRCRRPSSWRAASRRTRSSARARSSPGRSCAAR